MDDYVRLPRAALTDELWANDGALLRVYVYLVKQSENGIAHVSTAQITRATKLTERRVRDALTILETSNKTSSKRSNKGSDITLCGIADERTLASNKTSNKTSSKRSSAVAATKPLASDYVSPPFVAPEFAETWRRFVEYRKEIRKPYKSESSERTAYNKMVEMANNDPEAAKDMVERTILGQWQGLFPLKDNNGTRTIASTDTPATRAQSRDRLRRLAVGVVSQSADKLLSLYDGVYPNSDTRQD